MNAPSPLFEPNLARASTLPARWYTDPAVYALEQERIFARTWQPAGRAEQVRRSGEFFTCTVAGEPLVVLRDRGGQLRAFYNVCRHRAGPVAEGCGRRQTLQCLYHGWTYALDGRLLAAPEFEGVENFSRDDCGLKPAAATVWGPFVFVHLDPDPPPLAEFLGAIPDETRAFELERMVACERREYLVRCNWKVYVDNYLEGYHVPVAHPALSKELDYANYRVETFRYYSVQHAPIRPAPAGAGERRYANPAGDQRALYYWVFPNWMLNLYPDNLSINIVVPLAPDRTLTVFEWYFHEPERPGAREAIARSVAFSDQIQQEDIKICEAVQARLGSRAYDRGRFSVRRENGVHHFQGLVCEFLTREQ
jgi:choline monooxygenase